MIMPSYLFSGAYSLRMGYLRDHDPAYRNVAGPV